MNEPQMFAWIFYALALASETEPANFAAISQVADGINHAVPTHKELQTSLKWLVTNDLVQKQDSGYSLTARGLSIITSVRMDENTTSKVWAVLTKALATCPT